MTAAAAAGLRVLVVDDVAPALDEMCQLLREAPGVTSVEAAADALTALRMIPTTTPDAVFLDISMPGMDGLELAGLLGRMTDPPAIVFVTAFEQHAVSAYGVGAVDYLLKPVSAERLGAALGRVHRVRNAGAAPAQAVDERLHTRNGSHLVRIPISRLEEHWRGVGYVRVHRSYLLAVHAVQELRSDVSGGLLAHTDVGDVPVSRRHARELRDRLLDAATRGEFDSGARRDGR